MAHSTMIVNNSSSGLTSVVRGSSECPGRKDVKREPQDLGRSDLKHDGVHAEIVNECY